MEKDKAQTNLVRNVAHLFPAQQVNQRVLKLYTHLKPDTVIKRSNFIDSGHQMGHPISHFVRGKIKTFEMLLWSLHELYSLNIT